MDTLYNPISTSVRVPNESIFQKSNQDVEDLLHDALPTNRHKDLQQDPLKHKVQILDAVREKWKRKSNRHVRSIISCQERRQLKVFDIQKEGHKFKDYIPLHRLWQDYMRDAININRLKTCSSSKNRQINDQLMKADYHGCMIVVKKTKCPSLLGQAGIILMETRNTFKIITKEDKIKCIPKTNCVFVFELDGLFFTIYGNQFAVKASERVKKQFKMKATIDIT